MKKLVQGMGVVFLFAALTIGGLSGSSLDLCQAQETNAKISGLARLEAGESVTEIAQSLGSQWQSCELANRANANWVG